MDAIVIRSMLKWPDVPDVYGWLCLDRRGNWRIRNPRAGAKAQFDPIGNAGLREFIARNYAVDERGCWFFQNGPQRVFVALAYAPFAFRLENGALSDHCGRVLSGPVGAWLDEEGSLLLSASGSLGLLDDRDLSAVAETLVEGGFNWGGHRIPVARVASADAEARFGFIRDPKPE